MFAIRLQFFLFFLSFILIGLVFWTGGDLVTQQLLSLSYRTPDKLQADTLPQVLLTLNFKVINWQIKPENKYTQVVIKTSNSLLKSLELEIPNSQDTEIAIAKKLGLSHQARKLAVNQQFNREFRLNLIAIKAAVIQEQGFSYVDVITANNSVKKLHFVLQTADVKSLEVKIAQLLNLSREGVRKLISYQVKTQSFFTPQPKQRTQTEKDATTEKISMNN
ncbi:MULTISPECIES: hypothetical protein [Calothrix]|uniref:Uncharacterized protein n=2 Tax=Calothrix TaxID=1186 RepID=A0ABR8A7T5_9CYAN|nr:MULTISPECIES: hypothetical protein [Calothrix]MBD2195943.1 hypothetical protein [Calothrix parietina FACHB-288]MBD2224567.1 hypothetical protein [Calothrix anomala FACHB-343]